ncbi:MAG: protease pro-enzyme activation domain-containing protein [Terriglobia bacterium]
MSALIFFSSLASWAQTANVPGRVTQAVDLENLVTLRGNTHPLARAEYDQGAAPDSLPMERMLLVLQRSAEQETALRKLLDEQQIKSSPNFHMWLTPEQLGEQFGPVDADIQAVTDWLGSQGFEVSRVAAGRTVIEFTGTGGAVRQAFHTEIHKFTVNGDEHWANANDPQIPAALAPVVAGFDSLNNFPRRSMIHRLGTFSRSKATGEVRSLYTNSCPDGNNTCYELGPTDFATIYNVLPLWQSSQPIDGTGQTIAIVGSSNINVQDVRDFRSLFGLPAMDPQIIVVGPDPGFLQNDEETEADLDVEWSGAVAKNATIELVVSEDTEASFGTDLSAVYIVDNNLAPVLTVSYGACESSLGVGGNAFYNSLWEQGAAQGITVLIASGDAGSAMCDQQDGFVVANQGLTVSGMASTPFNVAVGGTDFNDASALSQYWSSKNNSNTLSSALSYIPEMTWNDSCARSGMPSDCANAINEGTDLGGGGGGASNCLTFTGTFPNIMCTGGYAKPTWQSGNGVPNDGARDLPDVSLFTGNGLSGSFYAMCDNASCSQGSSAWYFEGVGGTSVSTPAFAGIMALVNQKTGTRQGSANYVLYPLAAKSGASCPSNSTMAPAASSSSCIFYDVVTGNNSMACEWLTPNCAFGNNTSAAAGILEVNPPTNPLPAWSTNAGYDLATGLGSVNATNLVKNWASVSFAPTTTALANLSPTTLTHGQPANFTVNVAPGSGGATPTGDVSLIAQTGGSPTKRTGIGSFGLSNGSFSGATNMLPGGTYGVTAHYAGNGTYGASDSTPPVQVTVNPEGSQTRVALLTFDAMWGGRSIPTRRQSCTGQHMTSCAWTSQTTRCSNAFPVRIHAPAGK